MICSCCGYEIKEKPHLLKDGTTVCDRCWKNPSLFFPDKLEKDERFRILAKLSTKSHSDVLKVRVMKFSQKDVSMYVGKMSAKDLLELTAIDHFKEDELQGYQRQRYEERTSELLKYLTECSIGFMPAIFVSVRDAIFNSIEDDFGELNITRRRGSIWVIDGQHRIGALSKARDLFESMQNPNLNSEIFLKLMEYELPVVFLNSTKLAEKFAKMQMTELDITAEDVERVVFFTTNKTQKGIQPSLKDALLYRINKSGITGLPILEKEAWRINAAYIGIMLNQLEDSPINNLINISGKRGAGKPIQLNSFVSSLRKLLHDSVFSNLSQEQRLAFVKAYWKVIKKMFSKEFDEFTWKNHMLLKAIGVYCLNWLAQDLFEICLRNDEKLDEESLERLMKPLINFDWTNSTSSFSTLGGMKGAHKGHEILLKRIMGNQENRVTLTEN